MNIFGAPHPRSRIYTKPKSYWSFWSDLLLGRFNKGNDVQKFERALAEKFGVPEAVCVSMTRVGIYLVLKNLIKPGQNVIMSPYTVADVVNMVVLASGVPVFTDIEQRSCNLNPAEVAKLIDKNTGAVIATHLHGVGARIYEILALCRQHNIPLIEDAAQSFGGKAKGKRLGTIGDVGIYSLGMYKNINSWYGGAVVAKDSALLNKLRAELAQYDFQSPIFILKKMLKGLATDLLTYPLIFQPLTYWLFRYGFLHDIGWINRQVEIELDLELKKEMPANYLRRYTPFQARLALSQLNQIDADIELRAKKAALYRKELSGISELVLPPEENDSKYIYPVFAVQYQDRKKLLKWLMRQKRDVTAQHLKNCADLESFSAFYRDCPVARKTANEVILLPTYTRYPDSEIKKNIEVIRAFFGR
ncbi:MAG: hypothetical protein CO003_01620 [Candidatus Portnoybacteria bacterium CG_4_8_14_3_um_filter_44_15]|uniref:Aminotransferase n=4 Tax=Candidatus Portnoyibacteriota TaxID=1817913 RepID=A0A2M7YL83_9BACT|nr:MAG: hypothetical protein COX45_02255 [Candidatus Portnoybacteria bacterium CG23_combo_of_CG06-09_8_20_14_all_44_36]PIW74646.1 MAG: hypothetical protein CO003_01620 [Candidatus Portnoybacteria bacterium CG_4_8_14_3_um_filter_44_15]PIZ69114.1 MAG: hypothetical protein COY10_02085 [Candidatus Portnoybacteria bacterium CG_4_10_14_0_2_um_filter_43_36]PJA63721.1 MAG: hypothetical protein CO160_02210 [Candidatus Portnoybacteria bacterium CG_4_9_14_3_um_filter_43_11]PJE59115.1 MAG: hypothetical pro